MAFRAAVSVSVLIGLVGIAQAQPATQAASEQATTQPTSAPDADAPSILDRSTLTDDWFGLGRRLSDRGLSVSASLTQVYQQNMDGGLSTHRRAGRYAGRYEVDLDGDLEKAIGLHGSRVMAQVRGGWSDGLDASSIGSVFGVNTTAESRAVVLRQLAYEQEVFGEKLRFRIGKIDLTRCFESCGCPVSFDGNSYANDETSQFLNGALVNNPTIPFPEPGLGAQVHYQPTQWWYMSAGVADANAKEAETGFNTTFHGPADFFSIYEIGVTPHFRSANGKLQGAYRVGFWHDPQPKERFDGGGFKRDDLGVYTSLDQMVWKENRREDDSQGLGVFGRFGVADGAVNDIRRFWSTGVQYRGLIPGRDKDVTGLGVGQGQLSRQAGFTRSNETVLEWYHNIELTPWLHLSPDVQYIFNPGGDTSVRNAVVVGLRLQMSF